MDYITTSMFNEWCDILDWSIGVTPVPLLVSSVLGHPILKSPWMENSILNYESAK